MRYYLDVARWIFTGEWADDRINLHVISPIKRRIKIGKRSVTYMLIVPVFYVPLVEVGSSGDVAKWERFKKIVRENLQGDVQFDKKYQCHIVFLPSDIKVPPGMTLVHSITEEAAASMDWRIFSDWCISLVIDGAILVPNFNLRSIEVYMKPDPADAA